MVDVTEINILKGNDFLTATMEFEEDLKNDEISFKESELLKEKVKHINGYIQQNIKYILGFGRGFFAGDKVMKYLVKKNDEYFWLVRDTDGDDHQFIYKIKKKKKKLFKFLNKNGLEKEIFEFDELLKEIGFWEMKTYPEIYEEVEMKDFYEVDLGENVEEQYILKEYIATFYPGNFGSDYAHKTFEQEYKKMKKNLV